LSTEHLTPAEILTLTTEEILLDFFQREECHQFIEYTRHVCSKQDPILGDCPCASLANFFENRA
jgi:endonuclease III